MKALLKKDFYSLLKQMKLYIIIILVFSCLPGYQMTAFAIIYAAMFPITALAYDERCKWPNLAIMMPFSPTEHVLSKYIIGYVSMAVAAICSILSGLVVAIVKHNEVTSEIFYGNAAFLLLGCFVLSILMPVMFRFGVEKGRILMIVLIALSVAIITAVAKIVSENMITIHVAPVMLFTVGIILFIIFTYVSIVLSKRFYMVRNFS